MALLMIIVPRRRRLRAGRVSSRRDWGSGNRSGREERRRGVSGDARRQRLLQTETKSEWGLAVRSSGSPSIVAGMPIADRHVCCAIMSKALFSFTCLRALATASTM